MKMNYRLFPFDAVLLERVISSLADKILSESSPLGRHQHQDPASEKSFLLPSLLILRRLEGMLRLFSFFPFNSQSVAYLLILLMMSFVLWEIFTFMR